MESSRLKASIAPSRLYMKAIQASYCAHCRGSLQRQWNLALFGRDPLSSLPLSLHNDLLCLPSSPLLLRYIILLLYLSMYNFHIQTFIPQILLRQVLTTSEQLLENSVALLDEASCFTLSSTHSRQHLCASSLYQLSHDEAPSSTTWRQPGVVSHLD